MAARPALPLAALCASLLTSAGLTLADPPGPVGEVEPNQSRTAATSATIGGTGALAFTGTSRGFDATESSIDPLTRDLWRITLNADASRIQRHRLTITTSGTSGHSGAVLGVQANSLAVDPASMVTLQSTSISTVPARSSVIYTLGNAAPWFLYRVTGSSSTTSPYTVSLTTENVSAVDVPTTCPIVQGPIRITTVGRTTLNTKIFLYDADTLEAIKDGVNEDNLTSGGQSTLVRTLNPGRYLLAIANVDTADHRLPPADDRSAQQPIHYIAESPGILVSPSSTATGNFSFSITDDLSTRDVNATKPGAFGIAFYRFTVVRRCGLADIGTAGGAPCHDRTLDNNDFVVFIDRFFARSPVADMGTAGGLAGEDGLFDNNDWIVFLDRFFAGCG